MKYSKVIGTEFYNIILSPGVEDMVDVHFTASAHHFLILKNVNKTDDRIFHVARHRAHLKELMNLVYRLGEFSQAKDESLRGLERRENWNPAFNQGLPDPRMFGMMTLDTSISVGEQHPFDLYLKPSAMSAQSLVKADPIKKSLLNKQLDYRRFQ
jgi:hypothetical protein